jgi:hypothetical protein
VSVLGALQIGRADPGPNTRIGRLFMAGSFCFAVASLPFMADFENDVAGLIYLVGSIFFTAAGAETFRTVEPGDRLDLIASAVQLAGTIFFNLNTYAALDQSLDRQSENFLIWLPNALGSLCFLLASSVAVAAVRRARSGAAGGDRRAGEIAWINLAGSVFFGFSALASVVLKTGEQLNVEVATWGTLAGAVCFFVAAYLLVPRRA